MPTRGEGEDYGDGDCDANVHGAECGELMEKGEWIEWPGWGRVRETVRVKGEEVLKRGTVDKEVYQPSPRDLGERIAASKR